MKHRNKELQFDVELQTAFKPTADDRKGKNFNYWQILTSFLIFIVNHLFKFGFNIKTKTHKNDYSRKH